MSIDKLNISDINDVQPNIKTTSVYEDLLNEFKETLDREERKYPLSEREKVFAETIKEILRTLDRTRL